MVLNISYVRGEGLTDKLQCYLINFVLQVFHKYQCEFLVNINNIFRGTYWLQVSIVQSAPYTAIIF
jgi:hypothetical protein